MTDDTIGDATAAAFRLLFSGDAELWQTILISLRVSLIALLIATPIAIWSGYLLATGRFRRRRPLIVLVQSALSFPTVVVGLILYLLFNRRGPLGDFHLLFAQDAMIIGQALIAFPVLAAFTLEAVQGADPRNLAQPRRQPLASRADLVARSALRRHGQRAQRFRPRHFRNRLCNDGGR